MKQKFSGACLCGQVTYTAHGAPVIVAQCHCNECRRLSGAGHSVGAMFAADAVTVSGAIREIEYTSAQQSVVTKVFCPTCGSPILGKNTGSPDHVTLTLGTMDDAGGLKVGVVIFERDAPHWDTLGDDVMRFATQPDWSPDP
jgi:hypothetical protein